MPFIDCLECPKRQLKKQGSLVNENDAFCQSHELLINSQCIILFENTKILLAMRIQNFTCIISQHCQIRRNIIHLKFYVQLSASHQTALYFNTRGKGKETSQLLNFFFQFRDPLARYSLPSSCFQHDAFRTCKSIGPWPATEPL